MHEAADGSPLSPRVVDGDHRPVVAWRFDNDDKFRQRGLNSIPLTERTAARRRAGRVLGHEAPASADQPVREIRVLGRVDRIQAVRQCRDGDPGRVDTAPMGLGVASARKPADDYKPLGGQIVTECSRPPASERGGGTRADHGDRPAVVQPSSGSPAVQEWNVATQRGAAALGPLKRRQPRGIARVTVRNDRDRQVVAAFQIPFGALPGTGRIRPVKTETVRMPIVGELPTVVWQTCSAQRIHDPARPTLELAQGQRKTGTTPVRVGHDSTSGQPQCILF